MRTSQRAGSDFLRRRHFIRIALIAIGVGTGMGIWRALVSPGKP
jgi:hypothetical protein